VILTGPFIEREVQAGRIVIEPFRPEAVNPNSYNYRLGEHLKSFDTERDVFVDLQIPESGYVLEPGRMYLGHTAEVIGSSTYAMSLIGRSSMGRLGLFLQVSADLGHTTSCHRWTLELVPVLRIRLYPGMVIGQVSFWRNAGDVCPSPAYYARFNRPYESRIGRPRDPHRN
jgi:dCTP deaminase